MFEGRAQYYYGLAAHLRTMAQETRFAEIRTACLKLASQFDRLATTVERSATAAYAAAGEDD